MKIGKERRSAEPKAVSSGFGGAVPIEQAATSRTGVYAFAALMFSIGFAVCAALTFELLGIWSLILSFFVGLAAMSTFKIAQQWERVVILRLGKYHHTAGPGLYVCIPFLDSATCHVDHRVMTSSFTAEAALTSDMVPVDVDAVLFWMVWDAEKACLEVENYPRAVLWSAQTAMRDAIGQITLGDISLRRKTIDYELGETLEAKCSPWGITVLSVEIRDISIPEELQDALSKEAQAERERQARIILADIEKDISEMFVEASKAYEDHDKAMNLRAMSMVYEGVKNGKGVVVVPSTLSDCFVPKA